MHADTYSNKSKASKAGDARRKCEGSTREQRNGKQKQKHTDNENQSLQNENTFGKLVIVPSPVK